MIRHYRELVATLARLTTVTAPLAMCIMDGTVSAAHQQNYALRFSAAGEWFQCRPNGMRRVVGTGEVFTTGLCVLPHAAP